MDTTTVFLYVLMGLMIVAAIAAVELANLLACAFCVGAVGFLLSLVDLLLGAPDIMAFVQVVVEVACLVILVRALAHRREPASVSRRWSVRTACALLALGLLLVISFTAILGLVDFGMPLNFERHVTPWATDVQVGTNAGTNIFAPQAPHHRTLDTLGAIAVVFACVVGAFAVLRPVGRLKHETPDPERLKS